MHIEYNQRVGIDFYGRGCLPHDTRGADQRELVLVPSALAGGHVCEDVVSSVARVTICRHGVTGHIVCAWVAVKAV